jgi:hypothetical protein
MMMIIYQNEFYLLCNRDIPSKCSASLFSSGHAESRKHLNQHAQIIRLKHKALFEKIKRLIIKIDSNCRTLPSVVPFDPFLGANAPLEIAQVSKSVSHQKVEKNKKCQT